MSELGRQIAFVRSIVPRAVPRARNLGCEQQLLDEGLAKIPESSLGGLNCVKPVEAEDTPGMWRNFQALVFSYGRQRRNVL